MEGLGKDHAHGLPLVLQPRAQPALSPPLGGSVPVVEDSLLIPSSDPDDRDALRRRPGG